MALINCPECEGIVSDKAAACPHCGFPMQSHKTDTILFNQREYDITDLLPAIKKGNKEKIQSLIPEGITNDDMVEFIELIKKEFDIKSWPDSLPPIKKPVIMNPDGKF
jgi:hypothetical protein